ncbi:hypothetical protein GCM10011375_24470 [Hymenobacter qilianensis]|uniref:Uncharacterized protein n=2 Tax=Hymenobacter qilianensis TaxID=1385715 RepID=A0ACB5PSS9_9BACT|nr:hypothetical protein [Hymenobacter qilianensis]QNP52537.1 hypothetical protein H9L05_01805 [Hymenobacter qilianensis]GGF68549.1 hypothetical protein GCM10011375_24470 [Hymenobacter qilianensis]
MKIFTTVATLLALSAGLPALAQTQLNTQPPAQPSSPMAPASRPTIYAGQEAPVAGPALSRYRTSSLGIDLGWGGPYGGIGFYYAHMIGAGTDVNAGIGLGVGGKIGVGVRHFFSPAKTVSPYIGANLSRSGKINDVRIALNEGTPSEEEAYYNLSSSGVLNLRTGFRWQPGRVGLIGTLGYGVRFTGDPVTYTNGYRPSQEMRDLVDAVSPGGVEISLGMSIGFGQ